MNAVDPRGLSWCTTNCRFTRGLDAGRCSFKYFQKVRSCEDGSARLRHCFDTARDDQKRCIKAIEQKYEDCMKECNDKCQE